MRWISFYMIGQTTYATLGRRMNLLVAENMLWLELAKTALLLEGLAGVLVTSTLCFLLLRHFLYDSPEHSYSYSQTEAGLPYRLFPPDCITTWACPCLTRRRCCCAGSTAWCGRWEPPTLWTGWRPGRTPARWTPPTSAPSGWSGACCPATYHPRYSSTQHTSGQQALLICSKTLDLVELGSVHSQ